MMKKKSLFMPLRYLCPVKALGCWYEISVLLLFLSVKTNCRTGGHCYSCIYFIMFGELYICRFFWTLLRGFWLKRIRMSHCCWLNTVFFKILVLTLRALLDKHQLTLDNFYIHRSPAGLWGNVIRAYLLCMIKLKETELWQQWPPDSGPLFLRAWGQWTLSRNN